MSAPVYVVIETCRHEGIQQVLPVYYGSRDVAQVVADAKNVEARRLEIEEARHWVTSCRIRTEGARGSEEVERTRRKYENAVAELEYIERESGLTTTFTVLELLPEVP